MSDSPWRLDGKVVMVSGSSGGIGRSVVDVLTSVGASVSACDLSVDERSAPVVHAGNLGEAGTAVAWTERTLATWGRIDGLVNVAGIWRSADFATIDAGALQDVLAANFLSAWFACQAVLPHMAAAGSGAVVNFASTAGQFGSIRPAAHYAASKGAIIALTKSLAREFSPAGVRVNAISPGPIDTTALGSGVAFDDTEVRNRTLLRRAGTPDEIAQGVLYLASDASSFMTGAVLDVNGGSLL